MLPTQLRSTWYVSGKSLTHESLLNWYTTSRFAGHLLGSFHPPSSGIAVTTTGIPLEHFFATGIYQVVWGRSKAFISRITLQKITSDRKSLAASAQLLKINKALGPIGKETSHWRLNFSQRPYIKHLFILFRE